MLRRREHDLQKLNAGASQLNRTLLESALRRVGPLAANGQIADAELLRRFNVDRNEAAFAAIVARHGPLVWDLCRRLLPREADAEDAFQATFLALIQASAKIRTPAALGAWLHGVAYRVAMKARRTLARRRKREQRAAIVEASFPISPVTWDRLQAAVHEEIYRLPEPLRTAFVMCELEGMGQRQAAAALGWKLGTLSGRLTQARQTLLERLARQGVAAGAAVAGVVGRAALAAPPPILMARVEVLARPAPDIAGTLSQHVLELAQGATEVSMTRTKLFVAATALVVTLLVGSATTLIPVAIGQRPSEPGTPTTAPGDPFGQPHYGASTPRSTKVATAQPGQWEYKFVPRKSESLEVFQDILATHGAQGWEYCGVESLIATDPARKAEWGTGPTIVFKRPKVSAHGASIDANPSTRMTGTTSATSPMRPTTGSTMGSAQPGPALYGPQSRSAPNITVIRLAHAEAASLAKVLDQLFVQRNCRIVADPATNTLLVQGDMESIKALTEVVQKIDLPPAQPGGRKTP
jgi:RNA polymerase sigma factor (sigma-70 family)